jgi:hypothetical protein
MLSPSMVTLITRENEPDNPLSTPRFTIYPNPTTGPFILELQELSMTEKVHVEIFGMRGDKIAGKDLHGLGKHEFSLASFPDGLYFVRVIAGEKVETVKLLKVLQ